MSQNSRRIVVIGAGPAGLGVGWRLTELNHDNFVMYEKNSYVGGLATSFVDDKGFTWDVGGHVIHSHYPYFDRMFADVMQNDFLTHERESWVWMYNRFVPYPFQNNIHLLPKKIMNECLDGLVTAAQKQSVYVTNFRDWIKATYGDGIAKHFLYPYNEKVWAYPLQKMGIGWVGDRVAPIDLDRIRKHIRTHTADISWGPNAVFQYPARGGTGEIWKRVAKRFAGHIKTGKEIISIDASKRNIYFADGGSDSYDMMFTSMPLDQMVHITKGVRIPMQHSTIHHSSVTIVGIGIQGNVPENLRKKCWIYFPETVAPFFRATVLSNYSPFNAPKGTWSLMCEVASSYSRPLPEGDILSLVIEGAKKSKLISKNASVVSRWSFVAPYGYPTPTIDRDTYVDSVLKIFEKYDIYSRGRFGAWKYEVSNQDHTFMQGVEWVNRILQDIVETTFMYHI